MQKKKSFKKIVPYALMLAIVGTGTYGSYTALNGASAFFNKKENFAVSTKAGTLDLTLTDNTENHNLDPDNDGIINPGDYKPVKLNVANTAEKSMDVRVVLTLKSAGQNIDKYSIVDAIKLSDNSADDRYKAVESTTALKDVTGKNYKFISEKRIDDHTMQYILDLGTLNGSVETEDGITKTADDYEVQFYFDRLSPNSYIGDNVTLDATVYGIQHRNAQASDWDSIIPNTTAGGSTTTDTKQTVLSSITDNKTQAAIPQTSKRRLVRARVHNTTAAPQVATLQVKDTGASDWQDVTSDTVAADEEKVLTGSAEVSADSEVRVQTEATVSGFDVTNGIANNESTVTLDQEDLSAIVNQAKDALGATSDDTVKTGLLIASDAAGSGTVQVEGDAAQDFVLTEDTGNLANESYVAPVVLDNAENKSVTVNKTSGDNLYIYGYATKTDAEDPVTNVVTISISDNSPLYRMIYGKSDMVAIKQSSENVPEDAINAQRIGDYNSETGTNDDITANYDDNTNVLTLYTKANRIKVLGSNASYSSSAGLFKDCSKLTDISALSNWDTSNLPSTAYMFSGCSSLTDLSPISNWDTSNINNMWHMFEGCTSLTNLSSLNNWKTSNLNDMQYMFYGCSKLADISALGNWDVSNVNQMTMLFSNCSSLTDLSPLANWKTSNVIYMDNMFNSCSSLSNLSPLSNWNISSVSGMQNMFDSCSSLTDLSPLNNWDMSNIDSISQSSMFNNCNITTYPTWYKG